MKKDFLWVNKIIKMKIHVYFCISSELITETNLFCNSVKDKYFENLFLRIHYSLIFYKHLLNCIWNDKFVLDKILYAGTKWMWPQMNGMLSTMFHNNSHSEWKIQVQLQCDRDSKTTMIWRFIIQIQISTYIHWLVVKLSNNRVTGCPFLIWHMYDANI